MWRSPRRRCSALLRTLARRPPADPRPPRAAAPAASPMGSGTSRLYSALAKTLPGGAAAQHPAYLVASEPEPLEPLEPQELLAECRAVLHSRPPRCRRDFVAARTDRPSRHPPIRVMQWNILAQGLPSQNEATPSPRVPRDALGLSGHRGRSERTGSRMLALHSTDRVQPPAPRMVSCVHQEE